MKKNLVTLSIISLLSLPVLAQTNTTTQTEKIPSTTSLDKKIVKEGDKTHESLEKRKITPEQANNLDKNESNIANDLGTAKQDGKVTHDEKKHIKKELKDNKEIRKDMEKSNKEADKK